MHITLRVVCHTLLTELNFVDLPLATLTLRQLSIVLTSILQPQIAARREDQLCLIAPRAATASRLLVLPQDVASALVADGDGSRQLLAQGPTTSMDGYLHDADTSQVSWVFRKDGHVLFTVASNSSHRHPQPATDDGSDDLLETSVQQLLDLSASNQQRAANGSEVTEMVALHVYYVDSREAAGCSPQRGAAHRKTFSTSLNEMLSTESTLPSGLIAQQAIASSPVVATEAKNTPTRSGATPPPPSRSSIDNDGAEIGVHVISSPKPKEKRSSASTGRNVSKTPPRTDITRRGASALSGSNDPTLSDDLRWGVTIRNLEPKQVDRVPPPLSPPAQFNFDDYNTRVGWALTHQATQRMPETSATSLTTLHLTSSPLRNSSTAEGNEMCMAQRFVALKPSDNTLFHPYSPHSLSTTTPHVKVRLDGEPQAPTLVAPRHIGGGVSTRVHVEL